jgi:DNA-binding NarL/FixJ family response regulator
MQLLIADDSAVFRRALRHVLEGVTEIEKVDEAVSGEEAIRKVGETHPDLVIMDISMPGMDGLSAARAIKTGYPGTKLLILSDHQGQFVNDAVRLLGLDGFVQKSEAGEKLVPALLSMSAHPSH